MVGLLLSFDLYPWSNGRDGSTAVPVLTANLLQPCPAMLAHRCSGDVSAEPVENEVFLPTGAMGNLDTLLEGLPILLPPSFQ